MRESERSLEAHRRQEAQRRTTHRPGSRHPRPLAIVPTCIRGSPSRGGDSPSRSAQPRGRHIRRCADVGTTPIVPTSRLCRPDGWIACLVTESARTRRHNPVGRADASLGDLGDRDAHRSAASPEVAAMRVAATGGYLAGSGRGCWRSPRIVPTSAGSSSPISWGSSARSAQSSGRHNRRSGSGIRRRSGPTPSIWPAFAVWTGRLASAQIEDRRCGCCLRVGVG